MLIGLQIIRVLCFISIIFFLNEGLDNVYFNDFDEFTNNEIVVVLLFVISIINSLFRGGSFFDSRACLEMAAMLFLCVVLS